MFKWIGVFILALLVGVLLVFIIGPKSKSFDFEYDKDADILVYTIFPMSTVAELGVIKRIDEMQPSDYHVPGAYTVHLNAEDLAELGRVRFCGQGATTGVINIRVLTDANDIVFTQIIKWNTENWEEGQVAIQDPVMGLRFPCRKKDGKAFEHILEKIVPLELRGGKGIGSSGLLMEELPETIKTKFDIFGASSEGGTAEIVIQYGILTKLNMSFYGAAGSTDFAYSKTKKEVIRTSEYFPHTKLKTDISKLQLQQFGNTFLVKNYQGEYDMQTSCLIGEIFRHAKQYRKNVDVPDLQSKCAG